MNGRRVVLVMQARSGSTRLPGKVLKEVLPGRTMLDVTLERLRAASRLDEVVVASPAGRDSDPVAAEALRCGAQVFRGPEEDVLTRYIDAAHEFQADIVVRVTSDCPLCDPQLIDLHVERMADAWGRVDFITNMFEQSFPLGLAVEVMPRDVLERMARLSDTAYLREHVTTLAYEEPALFRIENVQDDENRSSLRWTVDYPEDLEFVRVVYRELYRPGRIFNKSDVLQLLASKPALASLNARAF